MVVRRLLLLGFTAALPIALGCSGGSDSTAPVLVCTDGGAAAANGVALTCGGATGTATELVDVVLGGPAAGSTTLRGVNFDLTYDPSKLEYVPAASHTSQLFSPDALVAVVPRNGLPGSLVVSIQEYGSVLDPVSVGAGQHVVLSLSFRRAAGTAAFGPTPLAFENAEATAASATIGFESALALAYHD